MVVNLSNFLPHSRYFKRNNKASKDCWETTKKGSCLGVQPYNGPYITGMGSIRGTCTGNVCALDKRGDCNVMLESALDKRGDWIGDTPEPWVEGENYMCGPWAPWSDTATNDGWGTVSEAFVYGDKCGDCGDGTLIARDKCDGRGRPWSVETRPSWNCDNAYWNNAKRCYWKESASPNATKPSSGHCYPIGCASGCV